MPSMSAPVVILIAVGFVSSLSWWILVFQLKRIPRPQGYRGGILRRYSENFPRSPLPWLIRACSIVFYATLSYFLWTLLRH